MLQLRFDKGSDREFLEIASKLAGIIHKKKKIFIVNNRVDIAFVTGSDGVHLGADDIDAEAARSILGYNKIVGRTIHYPRELKFLNEKDIDYFSVGPVFTTKTKPSLKPISRTSLAKIVSSVGKPLFAIGGINSANSCLLPKMNIKNISLCRGIILSKDIDKTTKELRKCLAIYS